MKKNNNDFKDMIFKKEQKDEYFRSLIKFNKKLQVEPSIRIQNIEKLQRRLKSAETDISELTKQIKNYRLKKQTQNKVTKQECKLIEELNVIVMDKDKQKVKKRFDIISSPFQTSLPDNQL